MKVLAIRQPWAYAICSGIQDVYTMRTFPDSLSESLPIGTKLLIYATPHPVPLYFCGVPEERKLAIKNAQLMGAFPDFSELSYDRIIGCVELSDITTESDSIWAYQIDYLFQKTPSHRYLVFNNPLLFEVPIPLKHRHLGLYFNVSFDKKMLQATYRASIQRPYLDGKCLKMPAGESIFQALDNGYESFTYDLIETTIDIFIDPITEHLYDINSIDFIGQDRIIHKSVINMEIGHFDENGDPLDLSELEQFNETSLRRITLFVK